MMNEKDNFIFISSMVRSGSTLLDKLLCNHEDLSVLSQPLPLIYVKAKELFYNTINHPENYYYLNNYFLEQRYRLEDLNKFLDKLSLTAETVDNSFQNMIEYSGQCTKADNIKLNEINDDFFIENIKKLLVLMSNSDGKKYFGSKEVLCEEFIPFLNKNEFKTIIIIRDPRDVINSIYNGKGTSYVGDFSPLLFNIYNWRKSVAFALKTSEHRNSLYIKFEDLASNTTKTLKNITSFLNIKPFADNSFEKGIFDQSGKLWKGNSSFGKKESISFTPKKYLKNLPKEVIDYIEFTCYPEMKYLGYDFENKVLLESFITNFKEPYVIKKASFSQMYSSSSENIKNEIYRFNLLKNKSNDKQTIEKYFIFYDVFKKFINQK